MDSFCDPETGVCAPRPLANNAAAAEANPPDQEILYVGDPMCSWCWSIAPALEALQDYAESRGLRFTVLVGGLRPGGGDAWTPQFKAFLRHHWEEISTRTGRPFSFGLLDHPHFNYDTEPPCRAVVTARALLREAGRPERDLLAVFASIQEKFFVANQDPNEPAFYESICQRHALDFAAFRQRFESPSIKDQTLAEFNLVRRMGVNGFPTVLFRDGKTLREVAYGYAPGDEMIATVRELAG